MFFKIYNIKPIINNFFILWHKKTLKVWKYKDIYIFFFYNYIYNYKLINKYSLVIIQFFYKKNIFVISFIITNNYLIINIYTIIIIFITTIFNSTPLYLYVKKLKLLYYDSNKYMFFLINKRKYVLNILRYNFITKKNIDIIELQNWENKHIYNVNNILIHIKSFLFKYKKQKLSNKLIVSYKFRKGIDSFLFRRCNSIIKETNKLITGKNIKIQVLLYLNLKVEVLDSIEKYLDSEKEEFEVWKYTKTFDPLLINDTEKHRHLNEFNSYLDKITDMSFSKNNSSANLSLNKIEIQYLYLKDDNNKWVEYLQNSVKNIITNPIWFN